MKSVSVTLQEAHVAALRKHLLRDDACEQVAYVFFGTATVESDAWNSRPHRRFLSREVVLVPNSSVIVSSVPTFSRETVVG
jgi:hypothetical protein